MALGAGGSCTGGGDEQPDKLPRMASNKPAYRVTHRAVPRAAQSGPWKRRNKDKGNGMGLILLEALLALVILVAIVWWTMFSGRRKGELPPSDDKRP
jgi:hypothetical protein